MRYRSKNAPSIVCSVMTYDQLLRHVRHMGHQVGGWIMFLGRRVDASHALRDEGGDISIADKSGAVECVRPCDVLIIEDGGDVYAIERARFEEHAERDPDWYGGPT